MVDINKLSSLAKPTARLVFGQVVKNRTIRFGDLVKQVPAIDQAVAREDLRGLEQANLIAKKSSAVEDFTTYYVTADGLEASRKISNW
jgi:DNA-binding HxlR family transcriptional regulator